MKKLFKMISLALVATLLLGSLVSCDSSERLIDDYIEAGYDVSVVSGENEKAKAFYTLLGYTEEEIDELEDRFLILCYKNYVPAAMIAVYSSPFDLKDELIEEEDGFKDDSDYVKAKEEGRIRGNCLLIYAIGNADVIFAGK